MKIRTSSVKIHVERDLDSETDKPIVPASWTVLAKLTDDDQRDTVWFSSWSVKQEAANFATVMCRLLSGEA